MTERSRLGCASATSSRKIKNRLPPHSAARAKGAGMFKMTLRPTVGRDPPGDDVEVRVTEDDATRKGAKRKRAPRTKGPCEHGVKPRWKCKVCGACPHGRRRSQCKECGGSQICEHGRMRSYCKECGGSQYCEHGRQRPQCRECGGSQICEHGRRRSRCKECGGSGICEHGRRRDGCRECLAAKALTG